MVLISCPSYIRNLHFPSLYNSIVSIPMEPMALKYQIQPSQPFPSSISPYIVATKEQHSQDFTTLVTSIYTSYERPCVLFLEGLGLIKISSTEVEAHSQHSQRFPHPPVPQPSSPRMLRLHPISGSLSLSPIQHPSESYSPSLRSTVVPRIAKLLRQHRSPVSTHTSSPPDIEALC